MSEKTRSGLKKLGIAGSVLVYLAFVAYSEYHFWNLVSAFVPPDFQVLGVIAVAASALSALILPVALHFWCREGLQRLVAWGFTIVHLVIVFANLILDSATVSGANVSDEFTSIYAVYVLPGTVAFYALGWLLVWATDSDVQRVEQAREAQEAEEDGRWALRKIIAQEKTRALTSAFQSDHAKRKIDRYAGRVAPRILAEELGLSPEELGIEDGETWDFWDQQKKMDKPVLNGHAPQTHQTEAGYSDPAPVPRPQRQARLRPRRQVRSQQEQPAGNAPTQSFTGNPGRVEPVNKERLWSNGENTRYVESYCPSCRKHVAAHRLTNEACPHCGVWIEEATQVYVLRSGFSQSGVVLDTKPKKAGKWHAERPAATHTRGGMPLSLDDLNGIEGQDF